MTTFNWNIANLDRHTETGVVFTIHYTVTAEDGTYREGAYGSVGIAQPEEGDTIIPFDDLTQEVVVGWTEQALGEETVQNVKDALQARLDEKRAPKTAKGVPWTTTFES